MDDQCCMLMNTPNKGQFLKPSFQLWKHTINNGDSCEEKAFAEDGSAQLGGCSWPPRSFICSFCKKQFRSAQALGGHMNVHRRDRAKLKQQSPTTTTPHLHHDQIDFKSFDSHFESDRFVLNHNRDTKYQSSVRVLESSNVFQEQVQFPTSRSEEVRSSSEEKSFSLMGFNVLNPNSSTTISSCKRLKTTVSTPSFLIKPCSSDFHKSDVSEGNSNSVEAIDLELKLGV